MATSLGLNAIYSYCMCVWVEIIYRINWPVCRCSICKSVCVCVCVCKRILLASSFISRSVNISSIYMYTLYYYCLIYCISSIRFCQFQLHSLRVNFSHFVTRKNSVVNYKNIFRFACCCCCLWLLLLLLLLLLLWFAVVIELK